jgi:murein DD-endopeptidase MepM/ murein hydrolase activator NlpD
MSSNLSKWGARLFPERQILVRTAGRVRYATLSGRMQASAAAGFFLGAAAVGYLAVGYFHFGAAVAMKEAQVSRAELSNSELRQLVIELQAQLAVANAEISGTQNRLTDIGSQYGSLQGSLTDTEQHLKDIAEARARLTAERDALQARLREAQDDASAKAGYAAQLAKNLEQNKSELNQTEAQRQAMAARIRQLEKDVQAANAHALEFKISLDTTEKRLEQISGEREKVAAERERLAAERDALKQKLHDIEARLAKGDLKAPPAAVSVLPKTTDASGGGVFRDVESMVAATGLDVENFIARLGGTARGEGGPYIALGGIKQVTPDERAKRDEALRKLLKALPLASPLGHYQVESPFGARIDPINRRQGFHPGVDLSSGFRSPIYSTAPGIVTYAAVRDTYGKFVEIDHGNGIVTRYAHLHRITVARGQKVGIHQEVGELGSTGRSTGPHLHYEVVVDGEPLDPEKFMEVGKSVVQISKR